MGETGEIGNGYVHRRLSKIVGVHEEPLRAHRYGSVRRHRQIDTAGRDGAGDIKNVRGSPCRQVVRENDRTRFPMRINGGGQPALRERRVILVGSRSHDEKQNEGWRTAGPADSNARRRSRMKATTTARRLRATVSPRQLCRPQPKASSGRPSFSGRNTAPAGKTERSR